MSKKLPYPRLELRWRRSTKKDGDVFPYYKWACDYVLCLFPKCTGDSRSNSDDKYKVNPVEYVLNTSYRSSDREPFAGDRPLRDGAHARWDSIALDIPAYSKYRGKYSCLSQGKVNADENDLERVREHMAGE